MEKVVTLPALVASPQRQDWMPAIVSEVTFSRTKYSVDHRATGVLFLMTTPVVTSFFYLEDHRPAFSGAGPVSSVWLLFVKPG
jgi:hypothetical protein